MSNNISANQVKQLPLFAELSRRDLKEVAELVERESYSAGEIICRQGETGHIAYFVESGELSVQRVNPEGIEQEVGHLEPGSFFGETSLLLGEPRDATVQAVEDATLLYLVKEDFDKLLKEQPSLLKSLQMSRDVKKKRHAPRLEWLVPGESVITHEHKHVAVLVRSLIPLAFTHLLILGAFGYWYLMTNMVSLLILGGAIALIPVLLGFYLFVEHYNDTYTVTNKRVVHEEHIFLIRETRDAAPLQNIQNINMVQEGWLAQIFNFGNLIIETAGEPMGHVVFRHVPQPERIQSMIFEQVQRTQAWMRAQERTEMRAAMHRRFGGAPSKEEKTPEPEPSSDKPRFEFRLPAWLHSFIGFLRYFVPPLWHEEGATITWRKHWIILVKQIWIPFTLTVAITMIAIWALGRNPDNLLPTLAAYGTSVVFLFPWMLWIFDDWQNDIYQVTASRIIDVEQRPFFLGEARREASLNMIQNISLEVPSLLGRILRYGSVTIETAGAEAFTFDYVKRPQKVQEEIFGRMEAFEKRQRKLEAERRQDELLEWFSVYDKMRQSASQ